MDGTKCEGIDCPLKETCYRFTAKANEFRQAYFTETPYNKETKECEYLWIRDIKK
jgi:hypothetical protein